jgi:hypothetical protein
LPRYRRQCGARSTHHQQDGRRPFLAAQDGTKPQSNAQEEEKTAHQGVACNLKTSKLREMGRLACYNATTSDEKQHREKTSHILGRGGAH